MGDKQLYLASNSPRRKQLLAQIISDFATISVEIDETPRAGEDPNLYVKRMALEKARAGYQQLGCKGAVLAGDTAIEFEGRILGKPQDQQHAIEMLTSLSGKQHRVLSSIALLTDSLEGVKLSVNKVEFGDLPESWIRQYASSGEPMDKAGAYAIQGKAAAWIRSISGSYSAIVGLPDFETRQLLQEAGILDEVGNPL